MRIIAGTARSLPLKTIEGKDTRPTTDKTKETLFNVMQFDVPGAYFLDLFAGSGQIGLVKPRCSLCCICGEFKKSRFMHRGQYPFYKV